MVPPAVGAVHQRGEEDHGLGDQHQGARGVGVNRDPRVQEGHREVLWVGGRVGLREVHQGDHEEGQGVQHQEHLGDRRGVLWEEHREEGHFLVGRQEGHEHLHR